MRKRKNERERENQRIGGRQREKEREQARRRTRNERERERCYTQTYVDDRQGRMRYITWKICVDFTIFLGYHHRIMLH